MKAFLILGLLVFSVFTAFAQNEKAFVIYNSKGKKVSYKKMLKASKENELVFFGEFHDNPISHWLQLELTEDLFLTWGTNLRLGFEMFERDQQHLINKYQMGEFNDKQFKDTMRMWPNYKTDYEPLVQFANRNKLFVLGSNIPRRYASLLFKKGMEALEALPADEKSFIVPLDDFPVDTSLSQYKNLLSPEFHDGGISMVKAQAIKDATMAHFILQNMTGNQKMIHYNGCYHSDFYQGIMWYVQRKKPELKILTISTVTQNDISKLEKDYLGKADFIICVPESMTKTH